MNCPKCSAPIGRFDLAPNCKKCGVHIMYYTQEEDLMRDAKKTELEFTSARLLVAQLKAAYIKGKIPVLRIIFGILSVASLLLPLYNIKLSFPWWEYEISVGALGVYNIISDSFWKVLPAFGDLGVAEGLYGITVASFVLLILTALIAVVCLGLLILSFLNIKKTAKISCFVSAAGILTALINTVLSIIAVNISGGIGFVSVKPFFGGLLTVIILGAFLATNIILAVAPPEITVSEADRKRLEIKEMLKKGEITLDELPLPIVKEDKKGETKKPDKRDKKKRGKKK